MCGSALELRCMCTNTHIMDCNFQLVAITSVLPHFLIFDTDQSKVELIDVEYKTNGGSIIYCNLATAYYTYYVWL